MSGRGYRVAVVGATGMVGRKMVEVLFRRKFPLAELKLLASARSAGLKVKINGVEQVIEEAVPQALSGLDFAFFSAGGETSRLLAPEAVKRGAVVIDNSSAFRMEKGIPLVIPEVNPQAALAHRGLIANPNCSTIQMVMAIYPLHVAAGLKRVVVSTYQAVSGAGREALKELENQSRAFLEGREIIAERIPYKGASRHHQIAFNAVPQLDLFDEDGYTKEELKMVYETRKILGEPELKITATAVRIPAFNSHSESLNLEFERPLSPQEAREALARFPGLVVVDDPKDHLYPMPIEAEGRDEVFVGRIRLDPSVNHGLNMWVVADNILKGAATNSIQIAELLLKNK